MTQEQGLLAICFQEALTAIVRLRSGRQGVSDAAQFREQTKYAFQNAAREARDRGGYSSADVRSATFAVVAFLDESILNSSNALFSDWVRRPLQEELFGTHVAGDVFFENIRELLGQPDSTSLADVLEVYSLCLSLGFAGRYTGRKAELGSLVSGLRDRIRRIRPSDGDLSPNWIPPERSVSEHIDPWMKRLTIAAIALACLAVLLFVAYKVSLWSAVTEARDLAMEVRH